MFRPAPIFAAAALAAASCTPLSTLRGPHPLPNDATEWTVSASYLLESVDVFATGDDFSGPIPTVMYRQGSADDVDWGARFNWLEGLSVDIHKRFRAEPMAIAGGLGLGTFSAFASLLAGGEHVYVGGRVVASALDDSGEVGGGAFAGLIFGREPIWVLEASWVRFATIDDDLFVLSLAMKIR